LPNNIVSEIPTTVPKPPIYYAPNSAEGTNITSSSTPTNTTGNQSTNHPTPVPPTANQSTLTLPTPSTTNTTVQPPPLPAAPSSASDLLPLDPSKLDGKWFLKSVGGKPTPSALRTYYLIISSSASRIILYGGCNVQFSTFTLHSNQISFSALVGTKMACQPDNDSLITSPLFLQSTYTQISEKDIIFYSAEFKQSIAFTTVPPI
jgi:heat shock protein HslJ